MNWLIGAFIVVIACIGGIAIVASHKHSGVYSGKWPHLVAQMQARKPVERPTVVMVADETAIGNGFMVGPGLVLTVAHVVPDEGMITAGGFEATVAKLDRDLDLALLRVQETAGTLYAQFADAVMGEPIRVMGYLPWRDGPELVVYKGTVADVDFGRHILVGGASQPGLSGSPMLNDKDQVVAIFAGVIGSFGMPNPTSLIGVPASVVTEFIEGVE